MAYLRSNICTKNYWNRTTIIEIIVGGWVVSFFETPCIDEVHTATWPFIMAALWNRASHYVFVLWFLISSFLFLLSFFPRLISAVADWMSTILPHMMWP